MLQTSISEANQQMQNALLGIDGTAKLELLSLERHLFSSTAHYRLTVAGKALGDGQQPFELLFVDRIDHGPFPLSRLQALKLMPVMATSNFELEKNPLTEPWFAATQGVAPLSGQVSLGYDGSSSSSMRLQPLDLAPSEKIQVKFSGLDLQVDASAKAEDLQIGGNMTSLQLSLVSPTSGPLTIDLQGLTLDSDRSKGSSGLYMGTNQVKLKSASVQMADKPPVLLSDLAQSDSLEEVGNSLNGRLTYDIGMISYDGKQIGGSQQVWSLKNLDLGAVQSLVKLYESKLQPLQTAALQGSEAPQLDLSDAEQAQLKADFEQLLAAKPQIALEKMSFKTTNGESHLRLALDLNKPESFDLPAPLIAKQLIGQLDAKLVVSKPMIGDVVGVQAAFAGQTDQQAIAEQASMMSEMASSMAVASQMATVEGDNIVSSLHYANDQVDFNGRKMTVEEFVGMFMAMGGGMGMQQDDAALQEGESADGLALQAPAVENTAQ
ncbi:hypothetical protein A9179_09865 [Pseudomonas alcaligenes]|uniref:DUF945 domain-containing protein n=1 Tax=Aquipseudomonas alcaligenes TaxID=43263 RepID=A0ABR7S0M3_AQUAC|nr:hypothetical protein [Pseudomonas alcaligenes]